MEAVRISGTYAAAFIALEYKNNINSVVVHFATLREEVTHISWQSASAVLQELNYQVNW